MMDLLESSKATFFEHQAMKLKITNKRRKKKTGNLKALFKILIVSKRKSKLQLFKKQYKRDLSGIQLKL